MTDLLCGCGLPQAWAGQPAWRILDTRFDQGLAFLSTWQTWKTDLSRPRLLHYVALTTAPPQLDELLAAAAPFPELLELAQELTAQWFGLLPGFHRLSLDGGRILLTLCVGELTALLRQQQFVADSVYLHAGLAPWNGWTAKALARCCRRGTGLSSATPAPDLLADLAPCGFEMQPHAHGALSGQFNPRWTIKSSRNASISPTAAAVGSCVVIGAGLAGASVAAALALRGWQVQVLDQGAAPAAGASGLPVGLVVPHVSADDCALSRLSRSGVRLMLEQARRLLQQGQDWEATGVQQRQLENPEQPDLWHAQAAWLKPAQLVRAWLAQPGVTFQGNAQVARLRPNGDDWELLDVQGQLLARANRVVLANASGAVPLLAELEAAQPSFGLHVNQLPAMHGVRGLLSWAKHPGAPDATFPLFPVNGAGSVIPNVPLGEGASQACAWYVGSSYQPATRAEALDAKNHAANFGRLQKLLPALAQTLAQPFAGGHLQAWKNTRCVTSDRLPVVGPLYPGANPSLWICAGMGSRGMSFAVLCAQLLAARWGAEPLPVEAGLAQSLTALRAAGSAP